MQTRPLGASGLHVSRLGLGTMSWGRDVEWAEARDLLHEFVGAGGNLVDTAPAYGAGVAEKMIGKAIASGLPRESLIIATKAGFVVRDGRRQIDTSRGALLTDLEASLRRLRTGPRRPLAGPRVGRRAHRGDAVGDGRRGRARHGALRRRLELRRLADRDGGHLAGGRPFPQPAGQRPG